MTIRLCKLFLSCIAIVFISFAALVLVSCSGGDIVVKLYDNDNFIKDVNVTDGKEYNFGALEKVGYTFLGWYSEKAEGEAFTDNQGSSAGMTWDKTNPTNVYAHWQANRYVLTLNYCGATSFNDINEITVTYDSEITNKLPVPQKSGRSFLGWYTAESDGIQITDSSGKFLDETKIYNNSVYPMSNSGTTLYAHWGDKMMTYMFLSTDDEIITQKSYAVGTILQEIPLAVKDNYCFVGWCFDQTLLNELELPYSVPDSETSVVMLYAKFIPATIDLLQFTSIPSTGDKEYEVSYSGDTEKLVIPDSYYGKAVTQIRRINSASVKEIILPQTIKQIMNGAFEGCVSLEKINLPLSLETIPERCFSGCVALKNIEIPQEVVTIRKEAFAGCSSIEIITLSANISTIGDGAFKNMTSLTKFQIDKNNSRYMVIDDVLYCKVGISSYLVQYPLAKQGDTYDIDESVTKILDYAFSGSQLSSIVIGGKISTVGKGAFANSFNLVNVSIISDAVSFMIEDNAFQNCNNLRAIKVELSKTPILSETAFNGVAETFSVYVPSSMVKMYQNTSNWKNIADKIYSLGSIYGDFAVEDADGGYIIRQYFGTDKEVVIPSILNAKKIIGICANAFSFSAIEEVTIPQYVVEIGDSAFKDCNYLSSIIMECAPPILGDDVFTNISEDFAVYIKNTADVLDLYRQAEKWKDFSDHIWSYQ